MNFLQGTFRWMPACGQGQFFNVGKELAHVAVQSHRELDQRGDRRGPFPILDHADMGAVEGDAVGQLVLADVLRLPDGPDA